MNVALGDHQVTNYQADVEARTIGAKIHTPVVYDGRWPNFDVAWDIPPIDGYPFTGSAIVYWDGGPVRPEPGGAERRARHRRPAARATCRTRAATTRTACRARRRRSSRWSPTSCAPDAQSQITDTCVGLPCFDGGFTGP